jgi:RNA polymerase sigma-70 factor, ECF subfamily
VELGPVVTRSVDYSYFEVKTAMAIGDFDWKEIETDLRKAATEILFRYPGPKPSAASLVHGAWLELASSDKWDAASENHLKALAVRVMRHKMLDDARKFYSQKHGGGVVHEEIDPARHEAAEDSPETILRVNEALEKLSQEDERAARVFEYYHYGGFTQKEIAETLEISETTVRADLRWAKAWLKKTLGPEE